MKRSRLFAAVRSLSLCLAAVALVSGAACKKGEETETPEPEADPEDDGDEVSVEGREPTTGEPLSEEDFIETADYRAHGVVDCYTKQFGKKKKAPTGDMKVHITIAGDGSVTNVEFDGDNELKDDTLHECASAEIKSWKFDSTGATDTVVHPFVFELKPGELL